MRLTGCSLLQENRQRRLFELEHGPGPEEIPMCRDGGAGFVSAHFGAYSPGAIALAPPPRRVDVKASAIDDNPSAPAAELRDAREVFLNHSVAFAKILLFLCCRKGCFEIQREAYPRRVFRERDA